MANEIQKQEKPMDIMKAFLNAPSVQEQFKNALGEHKDAFVASLIDLYGNDKQLQGCKQSLVIAEALRAATLKLPLNKALGFSYIIVFNNSVKDESGRWQKVPTPTFVPGYKGYIQLAMRTGQYRTINADFVFEGEMRKVSKLTGEIAIDGKKVSDKIVGYFCYFELLNGFSKTLYMSVEDMASYALRYSPSFRGSGAPSVDSLVKAAQENKPSSKVGWNGNFNDMALKTVIRRLLSKYGYLSVEMQGAMETDIESSEGSRNDLITENANAEVVDINAVPVETVDAETGEIKNGDNGEASADNAGDEPNY